MIQNENQINFGLNLEKQKTEQARPENYQFGAVDKIVLMPDGDWIDLTPECEIQKGDQDDWMDCVTESAINIISLILQKKFGIKENWSQRFTAQMSGTTRQGNSLYAVADSIRHDGIVLEVDWPRNRMMGWLEYYRFPYESVKQKGKKWIIQFDVNYESIPTNPEALDAAQVFAPPQVIGPAWYMDEDGIYHSYGYRDNHAFVRIKKSYGKLQTALDSYPTDYQIDNDSTKQEFIKTLSADYQFGDALLYSVSLNTGNKKSWIYKIINLIKNMLNNLWSYADSKGIYSYFVKLDNLGKPVGKQKIDRTKPQQAIDLILTTLREAKMGRTSNWGELSQIPDKIFVKE